MHAIETGKKLATKAKLSHQKYESWKGRYEELARSRDEEDTEGLRSLVESH